MARGLNKVMVIGYLGRDPEMRYTPNGKSVVSFSIACDRSWKNADGEKQTETDWFNVVAWGDLAEICNKYLSKGSQAYIEGRIQTRTWQDNEGQQRTSVDIVAQQVLLLNKKKESNLDGIEDDFDYPF
ncbi:MAG TPA: single-stranded DNA-binding protein [Anaerolineaceae bacterium]|jgi:single-strand DNA-binding protein|nr:single-stranded DNA-binding protein [Anaerolineaceae bacterium]